MPLSASPWQDPIELRLDIDADEPLPALEWHAPLSCPLFLFLSTLPPQKKERAETAVFGPFWAPPLAAGKNGWIVGEMTRKAGGVLRAAEVQHRASRIRERARSATRAAARFVGDHSTGVAAGAALLGGMAFLGLAHTRRTSRAKTVRVVRGWGAPHERGSVVDHAKAPEHAARLAHASQEKAPDGADEFVHRAAARRPGLPRARAVSSELGDASADNPETPARAEEDEYYDASESPVDEEFLDAEAPNDFPRDVRKMDTLDVLDVGTDDALRFCARSRVHDLCDLAIGGHPVALGVLTRLRDERSSTAAQVRGRST